MSEYEGELVPLVDQLNRSAAERKAHEKTTFEKLLSIAVERRASDLILVAGSPAILRVNGALTAGAGPLIAAAELRELLLPILTPSQSRELEERRSVDLCFVHDTIGRFRANLHYQRGTLAAAIRVLPEEIPSLESLHLPAHPVQLAERRQGLVLLTGPTGCGKSSSFAALIDLINSRRRDHIITIEDPIEFQHPNRSSLVEQIELGHDTPSFSLAVRAALRQDPDVILIGEMRDSETMAAALTAAEPGHLVLSSMHTDDAAQTVSRVLDIFPSGYPAAALSGVAGRHLTATHRGHRRITAVSRGRNNAGQCATRNLIRHGDDHQLRANIETGRGEGMLTMEQSLADLVRTGKISRDVAFTHSFHAEDLQRHLGR